MMKEVKVVTANAVEPRVRCKGISARRLITKTREGAEKVMLGVISMDPHSEELRFSEPPEGRERVYYVMKGTVTIQWDNNTVDVQEGQAVFLPTGRSYSESNRTGQPALLVYALAPPLE